MLSNLGWRSLKYRRYDTRLATFFKIYHGLVAVPMPSCTSRQTARFPYGALWCKIAKKYNVVLLSFNFSSKLMRAANYVRICQNPFCGEVHYLKTKMIQIKPYIICSSHQLGLEVRYYVVPFFAILQDKRNIFSFYATFFRLAALFMKFLTRVTIEMSNDL